MARQPDPPSAQKRGVWSSDAPPGQVAIVVIDSNGERLVRVEMAQRIYSRAWVTGLEEALNARWDRVVRIMVDDDASAAASAPTHGD